MRADMEFSPAEKGETAGGAPPLPLSEHIVLPQPKTIFSLRRQAKFHTAGISFADSGKFHSPQANFTVQPPTAVVPFASLRDGSKEPAGTATEQKSLQRADMDPPLLYRDCEISVHPTPNQNIFSLRRKAKHHAAGTSLSACGRSHSPKVNFMLQPLCGGCFLRKNMIQ